MTRRTVLVTAFNREKEIEEQIDFLRKAGIDCIYVFCDGPRGVKEEEDLEVGRVHKFVKSFSNDRQIIFQIADSNLGCRKSVETAISWFFCNEASGVILEDDVKIDEIGLNALFTLLREYQDASEIGSLTVCSYVPKSYLKNNQSSLRLSNYIQSIAWGTWQDRWQEYNEQKGKDIEFWNLRRLVWRRGLISGLFWWRIMNKVKSRKLDTWDVPWLAHCWKFNLKTVVSNENYALHTGWGPKATHTKEEVIPDWARTSISSKELVIDEGVIEIDTKAEKWMSQNFYNENLLSWLRSYLSRAFQVIRRKQIKYVTNRDQVRKARTA